MRCRVSLCLLTATIVLGVVFPPGPASAQEEPPPPEEGPSAGEAAEAAAEGAPQALPQETFVEEATQMMQSLFEWRPNQAELISVGVTLVVVLLILWAIRFAAARARGAALTRKRPELGLLADAVADHTSKALAVLFAIGVAFQWFDLSEGVHRNFLRVAAIAFFIQAGLYASAYVRGHLNRIKQERAETDPASVTSFGLLNWAARVVIWSVVFILVLQNAGADVTALVAGLGVGGIAVAFALQNILGDIFCSVAIVLDKPFNVGDFILVDDKLGVVDHIGVKTTRVKSLSGEQLVFSNADLVGSRIHNFKKMEERRVAFHLGIVYETPLEKLERVPDMLREAVESTEHVRFDRAHFQKYGDFSLDFEIVYYVYGPDYNRYMDVQQAINLKIFRRFQDEGISFAYPTRELIIRPNETGASPA